VHGQLSAGLAVSIFMD